jgi:hypothetical protein
LSDYPPIPSLPYDSAPYLYARDTSHLDLLAMFHYIGGGTSLLFSCFPLIYLVLGILMINGKMAGPTGQPGPPPAMGWMFIALGVLFPLIGWTMGILVIYSGRCIKARRRWLFSLIMAGIMCINVPIGTVLGVFTFIVLLRDSVKRLYGIDVPPPYPAPPQF